MYVIRRGTEYVYECEASSLEELLVLPEVIAAGERLGVGAVLERMSDSQIVACTVLSAGLVHWELSASARIEFAAREEVSSPDLVARPKAEHAA